MGSRERYIVLVLVAVCIVTTASSTPTPPPASNLRPIIGILTQPDETQPAIQFIIASYVKWIESAGGRVVPVLYNSTTAQLTSLFSSINGLLYTGGGQTLDKGLPFYTTAKLLYDLALQANNKGDYFPLWGTCQGFQFLYVAASGVDNETVLDTFDSWDISWPLYFTSDAKTSRLFGAAPEPIMATFSGQNVTMNWHHYGVAPSAYKTFPKLNEAYNVLSTNYDRNNKIFISSMEGKVYPFYGSQFHPEYTIFEWDPTAHASHTRSAVTAMQYLGDFFVEEARRNTHKFPAVQQETQALIYNYNPVDTMSVSDMQTYFW